MYLIVGEYTHNYVDSSDTVRYLQKTYRRISCGWCSHILARLIIVYC